MTRRHDRAYTKCICGHLAAYHDDLHDRPYPCRMCECEDFLTPAEQRERTEAWGLEETDEHT